MTGGVSFHVIGTPGPQGSKRHVGNGIMRESSAKVAPWRQDVVAAALKAWAGMGTDTNGKAIVLDGPLALTITFRFPATTSWKAADKTRGWRWKDRTPDLDKLLRSTGDALTTSGLIADDARIVAISAEKIETTGWTGAAIHIGPAHAYPEATS